jgi:hypothetical protein
MARPVVKEHIHHVGVSGERQRARRRAAVVHALSVVRHMDEELALMGQEFTMEVHSALVLALSYRMANSTSPARAAGVLAAGAAGIMPAWRNVRRTSSRTDADLVFANPSASRG